MSDGKSKVRIRRAEFSGQEDKFYAPSDDIRNCALPIVRGALQELETTRPEWTESLGRCAVALAEFYQDAFLAERKVPDLMGDLMAALAEEPDGIGDAVLAAVGRGMLVFHAVAQRETSGHPDMTRQLGQRVTAVGSLLAGLPESARMEIRTLLKANALYPDELDRPPQEGVVLENED